MRCLYPRTVGFASDGKTLSWSQKTFSKEYSTFQLPCGKCIECRLEYARQWAVRCVHEAQMHENNSFITLTYSDESLSSDKLYYDEFRKFIGRLRDKIFRETVGKNFGPGHWSSLSKSQKKQFRKDNKELLEETQIAVFVTGEYGEKTKRPHWHALIFNWKPNDCKYQYSNERGDRIYSSRTLGPFTPDEVAKCKSWEERPLWKNGKCELGAVTFESAGYVARYAAKKLVHGKDDEHEYQPISKKSSKHAIGKRWLEKFWEDIFRRGECMILNSNGETQKVPIPRYYIKWLEKNKPNEWIKYMTKTKLKKEREARARTEHQTNKYHLENDKRKYRHGRGNLITNQEIKIKTSEEKFKRLMQYRKENI